MKGSAKVQIPDSSIPMYCDPLNPNPPPELVYYVELTKKPN